MAGVCAAVMRAAGKPLACRGALPDAKMPRAGVNIGINVDAATRRGEAAGLAGSARAAAHELAREEEEESVQKSQGIVVRAEVSSGK